jgi:hypothetical protein
MSISFWSLIGGDRAACWLAREKYRYVHYCHLKYRAAATVATTTPNAATRQQPNVTRTRLLPPINVSAVRQQVGTSSTCLALVSGLPKRFGNKVKFIKPVGQRNLADGAR